MERTNPAFQENYPEWKKILWDMLRTFVASFIVVGSLMLQAVTVDDFKDKESIIELLTTIGVAGLVAGVIGVGKYLRDLFPDSAIVSKLPF